MTKTELFLKLAAPDKNGVSRWVYVSEFVGEYADWKWSFMGKKRINIGKKI